MDDSKGGKVPQHRGVERSDQGPFGFVAAEPTKVDFRGKLKIGKWGAGSRTFPAGRVARPERGNPLARQGTAPCSPLPCFHRPALLLRRGLQLLHRFVLRLHSLFHQTARFFSRGLIHGRAGNPERFLDASSRLQQKLPRLLATRPLGLLCLPPQFPRLRRKARPRPLELLPH